MSFEFVAFVRFAGGCPSSAVLWAAPFCAGPGVRFVRALVAPRRAPQRSSGAAVITTAVFTTIAVANEENLWSVSKRTCQTASNSLKFDETEDSAERNPIMWKLTVMNAGNSCYLPSSAQRRRTYCRFWHASRILHVNATYEPIETNH